MAGYISSIINGETRSTGSEFFESRNPAQTNQLLATFADASEQECEEACLSARRAFNTWKSTPAPVRASVIENFGVLISKNKEALSILLTREMGKPLREARGDVQEAVDTCHFFVSEGRRLYGQTIPSEMPEKELFTYRRPLGVFACITAGNFPFAVPAWYIIPALLTGNTIVWKPSEDTPLLSQVFAELLFAAGVPKGVFHVVFGRGNTTGQRLLNMIDKGLVDKVGFTGSTEVGRNVGERAGRNLQTPCLELGGKNPMIVTPEADIELAMHGAVWSAFGTAGQRCTSLGNLILHRSIKDTFLKMFVARTAALRIGNPEDESITYGPLLAERFLTRHEANLASLVKGHHKLEMAKNGRISKKSDWENFSGDPQSGYYAFPSIVSGVRPGDEIYSTETFGPLINVLEYNTLDEAIELANGTGYGLSSSIYSNNAREIYRFKTEISAGMSSINNSTTGAEAHLPFGGNGKSGNGSRQSGIWVLDQFTRWHAVNWDLSGKLQLAQMDTGYITSRDYTLDLPQAQARQ
jgi:acyl-CoA reductase-like NAD-dependent aldehyde dehydrogenase